MHATERQRIILAALQRTGFVSYRDLEKQVDASAATIRRDLAKLEVDRLIERVHGGAKFSADHPAQAGQPAALTGTPFAKSLEQNLHEKRAIGKAAAGLCGAGEGVIIDGGTTTYQMCEHLGALGLQVLTNSLHIVNALLKQEKTKLLVPSGPIFREQNIILAPAGEKSMPNFHASKLFMGAAAVSARGIFQKDALLVASQRRLLEHADEVIVMVDSSKLAATSGTIVCPLDRIDRLITDSGADESMLAPLRQAGLKHIDVIG